MPNSNTIELFLSQNSSLPNSPMAASITAATLKTKYRPDKIFIRDEFMKWDMILNGIDCPHRMSNGAVLSKIDRAWLRTELEDSKEFKI